MINNTRNTDIKNTFNNTNAILTLRQPKNLLRILTSSRFNSNTPPRRLGLFKCKDMRCLICRNNWLQECTSFITANKKEWTIKCEINCNSRNVIYYLTCFCCNLVSYTGKTTNLRLRTNQHITECRHGKGMDKFDKQVFNCRQKNNKISDPYF